MKKNEQTRPLFFGKEWLSKFNKTKTLRINVLLFLSRCQCKVRWLASEAKSRSDVCLNLCKLSRLSHNSRNFKRISLLLRPILILNSQREVTKKQLQLLFGCMNVSIIYSFPSFILLLLFVWSMIPRIAFWVFLLQLFKNWKNCNLHFYYGMNQALHDGQSDSK